MYGKEPTLFRTRTDIVLVRTATSEAHISNDYSGKEAMKTVLLIDDNEDYRESVKCILEDEGLEVFDTDCPDSAFELLHTMDAPDLIICDLHMPFTTGARQDEFETSYEVGVLTVHELAWVYPETPVVAMSALERSDLVKLKKHLDPIPAYQKPTRIADMVEMVRCYLGSQEFGGMH
jgi:CheY-like chemotaxis protein